MKIKINLWMPLALFFGALFGVLAGYQVLGESRDYWNYVAFFEFVRDAHKFTDIHYRFEPAFTLLVFFLAKNISSNEVIYCLIAGAAVFVKYAAIFRGKYNWFLIFVFTFYFFTRYFILFEMTTLRAACAFSLIFLVFFKRASDGYKINEIALLVLAVLFHYSAIAIFPIYFIKKITRKKIFFLALVAFFIILYGKLIILNRLSDLLTVFSTDDYFNEATFIPIPFAIDILFLIVVFYFWRLNDLAMRWCALGIAISISIHFAMIDSSVIAGRFRELFSVFILIYVVRVMLYKEGALKYITIAYVLTTGFMHLYLMTIYDPLLS